MVPQPEKRRIDLRASAYTQADPIGLAGGLNRFGYGQSNPLGAIDPSGLASCKLVGLAVICDFNAPPVYDPRTDTLRPPQNWTPSWQDDLDNADNGPKNEFQFWRCKTDEDRDCRNRLIQLKLTYTQIKIGDLVGLNTFPLKEAYNAVARRYMRDCPYWETVPLFWLFGK